MSDQATAPTSVSRQIIYIDTGAPGVYAVSESDGSGFELGATRFVVNAGHPRESDLRVNVNLGAALASAVSNGAVAHTAGAGRSLADVWP